SWRSGTRWEWRSPRWPEPCWGRDSCTGSAALVNCLGSQLPAGWPGRPPRLLPGGASFGRQSSDEGFRQRDPAFQVLLFSDSGAVHKDVALQRLAREVHRPGALSGQRRRLGVLANAGHQAVLDDADQHVAAQRETDTAKHLLLTDVGRPAKCVADALRQSFVKCHSNHLCEGPATDLGGPDTTGRTRAIRVAIRDEEPHPMYSHRVQ